MLGLDPVGATETMSVCGATVGRPQEPARLEEFNRELIDRVARLGYSYLKIAAELGERKGPAFEAYKKLDEEKAGKAQRHDEEEEGKSAGGCVHA